MTTPNQPRRRVLLFLNQEGRCHWCNRRTLLCNNIVAEQATVDHVVPRGRGGSHKISNCVLACRECNQNRNRSDRHSHKGPAPQAGIAKDLLAALVEVSIQRDAAVQQLNAQQSWNDQDLGSAIHECGPKYSREPSKSGIQTPTRVMPPWLVGAVSEMAHHSALDKKFDPRNGTFSVHGKEFMSEVRISMGQPVAIFVYSLAILSIGCCIGINLHHALVAIWICPAAAALIVAHDFLTWLLSSLLTLRRFRREQQH